VPSAAWIAWRAGVQPDVDLRHALLLNYWLDPERWGYWFVETLVQILLVLALVLAVPAVARAQRRAPFAFACAALGVALAAVAVDDGGNTFTERLMSPHTVLWLFVLGWLVQKAATPGAAPGGDAAPPFFFFVSSLLVPSSSRADPARGAVLDGRRFIISSFSYFISITLFLSHIYTFLCLYLSHASHTHHTYIL
jgi:hypothetical protein